MSTVCDVMNATQTYHSHCSVYITVIKYYQWGLPTQFQWNFLQIRVCASPHNYFPHFSAASKPEFADIRMSCYGTANLWTWNTRLTTSTSMNACVLCWSPAWTVWSQWLTTWQWRGPIYLQKALSGCLTKHCASTKQLTKSTVSWMTFVFLPVH